MYIYIPLLLKQLSYLIPPGILFFFLITWNSIVQFLYRWPEMTVSYTYFPRSSPLVTFWVITTVSSIYSWRNSWATNFNQLFDVFNDLLSNLETFAEQLLCIRTDMWYEEHSGNQTWLLLESAALSLAGHWVDNIFMILSLRLQSTSGQHKHFP